MSNIKKTNIPMPPEQEEKLDRAIENSDYMRGYRACQRKYERGPMDMKVHQGNMKYIVHLKYPLMYWDKDHLVTFKKLDFPREPHIITQDGERYVELPKTKFKIGEDALKGLNYFVPITYYSLDDTPNVDIKQTTAEEE